MLTYTRSTSGQNIITTHSFDVANQLVTAEASNDPTIWHYSYDANGSLTEITPNGTPGSGARRYTYNAAGYLVMTETHDGSAYQLQAEMAYNGLGQRSSMTAYAGGPCDDPLYLHGDHLGSVSLTTNSSGAVVSQARYMPYGEVRWESSALPTDYAFTGQRLEQGFGLMDYQARFYSPYLNRFIQPDAIIPDPSDPLDWDRYSYTRNNPIRYKDPTGYWTEDELDEALGEGWLEKYFGDDAIFQDRDKLLEFLLSNNTTDPATLFVVSLIFKASHEAYKLGIDFSNYDAIGARLTASGGGGGFVGGGIDAVLNITSGELSVFASLEGGFMVGASMTVVGGITLITNMPDNSGFRDTAKVKGGMAGAVIGINIEGFSGGEHRFQDSSDVAHGLFVGVGGTINPPNAGVYGSLSYAVEILNVDQAGYRIFPNYPSPIEAIYNAIVDIGEILHHDILDLP